MPRLPGQDHHFSGLSKAGPNILISRSQGLVHGWYSFPTKNGPALERRGKWKSCLSSHTHRLPRQDHRFSGLSKAGPNILILRSQGLVYERYSFLIKDGPALETREKWRSCLSSHTLRLPRQDDRFSGLSKAGPNILILRSQGLVHGRYSFLTKDGPA